MIAAPTTNPEALATEIRRLLAELTRVLDALLVSLQSQPLPASDGNLKRSDGRLDDAGINALYADFATGQYSNPQLAARHDISLSGVVKRKAMWRRGIR